MSREDQCQRYEQALKEIAGYIDEQTALDQHMHDKGDPGYVFGTSRLTTYKKIARIAMAALDRPEPKIT